MGRAVECEAVVVGAGPAGSATAALLAAAGHQVIAVDRARFPRPKPCAEYVSPGAVEILDRLGALARLPADAGRRLDGMEIRSPAGASYVVSYCAEGRRRQALSVPRTDLDLALVRCARSHGAEVREGFRATDLVQESGDVRGVRGVDGGGQEVEVRARLVVGADGAHSIVSGSLGLRRPAPWPRRLGLVTHVAGVPWPDDLGQMWVGRHGYVGVAPVGPDTVAVGLVRPMPRGRLGAPGAALAASLCEYPALQTALKRGEWIERVRGAGPMAHSVGRAAGPGFLLVGDAAGFLDPFTGEGIFRALRGAELAAEAAHPALAIGDGPIDVAGTYEPARRATFGAKERLTWLIQAFVHAPALMDYAVARLSSRADLGTRFANVLGDLAPARPVLEPAFLWPLLRP